MAMRRGNRTYRSTLLLAAGLLIVAASSQKSLATSDPVKLAAEAAYLTQNTAAMNKMMAAMMVKPSGDVDHDFVAMMQPHHQGAIDMAQGELGFGHNEQLTRIAQGIIVEQLQEIAAMRLAIGEAASPSWITAAAPLAPAEPGAHAGVAAEAAYLARNNVAMNAMMTNMAVAATGDVDHDFVAMMVPHHQGAIDMAQLELRYGDNAQLKRVAQEIIVDQIEEIAMMRLALGQTLPPSISSPTQATQVSENTAK
jgi:uncharacterized protein (DUF305 family)